MNYWRVQWNWASKRGAKLILFGRNANALEQTAKEITTEVLTIACDVSKKEEVDAAVAKAIDHFAQIDVVINCAGQPAFGPVETLDQKTLEELFAVHVFGSLNVIQATLGPLKKQKGLS